MWLLEFYEWTFSYLLSERYYEAIFAGAVYCTLDSFYLIYALIITSFYIFLPFDLIYLARLLRFASSLVVCFCILAKFYGYCYYCYWIYWFLVVGSCTNPMVCLKFDLIWSIDGLRYGGSKTAIWLLWWLKWMLGDA